MSETMVIIKREFVERVRSRSFVLSTVLFPLLIMASWAVPLLIGSGGSVHRRMVIVDNAPAGLGAKIEADLLAKQEAKDAPTFEVERISTPFATVQAQLTDRVKREEIDGYLYLPADVLERNEVIFRADNIANFNVLGEVRRATSQAVQAYRLRASNIDPALIQSLVSDVKVNTARITAKGEDGGSAQSTFIMAYLISFLMYFMLIFYGVNVMRSVLEEKTNRISEVLISSVRAGPLMLGKILGVGAVAMLQIAIWAAFVGIVGSQTQLLTRRFDLPPNAFAGLRVEPGTALLLLAFFVLGFLLYSALYAALGAAMNTEQEAQQFQMVVLMPLIIPLLFFGKIAAEPLGETATMLGLIPFTAPLTNAMRMAASTVPALQLAASLAGMLVTVLVVAWLAGKIYRMGILSTGRRPSLRELGRWIRAA